MLSNSVKKHIKQLHQKKFRKQFEEFFVEGVKGVEEALNSEFDVVALVVEGSRRDDEPFASLIKKAEEEEVEVFFAGAKDLKDIKSTDTFPGVMAIIAKVEESLEFFDFNAPILALDGVADPGNLGTIIRTADWFGITNIILGESCVEPYNEKVVRSTMGSIFHVNIFESKNLEKTLLELKEKEGYLLSGLVLGGEELKEDSFKNKKQIFILGSESHGIKKELAEKLDLLYTIPGKGKAESLNVAIAGGIILAKLNN